MVAAGWEAAALAPLQRRWGGLSPEEQRAARVLGYGEAHFFVVSRAEQRRQREAAAKRAAQLAEDKARREEQRLRDAAELEAARRARAESDKRSRATNRRYVQCVTMDPPLSLALPCGPGNVPNRVCFSCRRDGEFSTGEHKTTRLMANSRLSKGMAVDWADIAARLGTGRTAEAVAAAAVATGPVTVAQWAKEQRVKAKRQAEKEREEQRLREWRAEKEKKRKRAPEPSPRKSRKPEPERSAAAAAAGPGRRRPELLIGSRSGWTAKEDALVTQLVTEHGAHNWVELAKHVKGRVGKQCRERWNNHLSPDVSKAAWTANEEAELMRVSLNRCLFSAEEIRFGIGQSFGRIVSVDR
eukprot:COSAG04_NODE_504_length_13347_cov_231.910251_13_plen_356_part_00